MKRHSILILIPAFTIGAGSSFSAQDNQSEVNTRQLWDMSLRKQRPAAAKKPGAPLPVPTADNYIGITLWRYRSSRPQDAPAVRMLVHEPDTGRDEDFTPERCEANTAFQVGQKVRLSIESARPGFLYLIDREQYADGSLGDAELIFPTQRMRHGDNRTQAGQVIDIPASGEGLFKIERRRPDLIGEELTILVSPQPIAGLRIGQKTLPITRELLADWKKNWGAAVKQLEEPGQAGKNLTPAEKEAAEKGTPLTDADALPQTLFEVQGRPGSPLLVIFPLKIQSN